MEGRVVGISNREIVHLLKEGNPSGCRHLVERFHALFIGEAIRVFELHVEDAEELVDDVLLAAVNNIQAFEFKKGEFDFNNWITTIFRNRVRDHLRKIASTNGLKEWYNESDSENGEPLTGIEREVSEDILRRYQESLEREGDDSDEPRGKLRLVAEALEKMETWERVLLRCRALEVPYEDIARYTGKPAKQLKVYHARVKKRFTQLLVREYPELVPRAKESMIVTS
jgi:RNA polymerase sigma factor (sigma-70 family)